MHFRLNLASRVYLDRRSVRRWLLLTGALLLVLLLVNLLYGFRNLQQMRQVDARLVEVEQKLVAQRGRTPAAYTPENFAQTMKQVAAANQKVAADRFRWSGLLSRFEELLPDDVAIRSLTPNYRDRSLQISAVARDTAAMNELLDALLVSGDMNQTYLLSQAPAEQPDGELVIQFALQIREAF